MLTAVMLVKIMPALPMAKAQTYLPLLVAGMSEFGINNELRAAAYLAQLAEESRQLTHWTENLNYSAKRLCEVWHRRFPTLSAAAPFAHNPQALAEKVYGFRTDLGNFQPGDGWKFRGRMPMQATGRDMYALLTELLDVDLISDPDACLDPGLAFRASAAIFARVKNCNHLADGLINHPGNFTIITTRINGGTTGLAERLAFYKRARAVLPDNLQVDGDSVVYRPDHFAGSPDTTILTASLPDSNFPNDDGGAFPAENDPADFNPSQISAGLAADQPADSRNASSAATIKTDFAAATNDGQTSAAVASPTEPVGDQPDAAPRWHFEIEDLKPFCQKWLARIWKLFGGSNTTFQTVCAVGLKFGGEYWWVFLAAGCVFLFVSIFVAVVASAVIGLIFWKNRGELERAKTFVAESIRDPKLFNIAERVIKKGLPK